MRVRQGCLVVVSFLFVTAAFAEPPRSGSSDPQSSVDAVTAEDPIQITPLMEPAAPSSATTDTNPIATDPFKDLSSESVSTSTSTSPEPSLEESPKQPDSSPSISVQSDSIDHEISPTRSVDEYERMRKLQLHRSSLPQYSVNLTLEPMAFSKVDLRSPTTVGDVQTNPKLFGVLLGFDYSLIKSPTFGIGMLGIDAGIYGSTVKDPYSGLTTAFITASPHVQYEGLFFPKQWVVPTVKLDLDLLRYNYSLEDQKVVGYRVMPRFEVGLLVFLNLFEPSAAGQMQQNYSVRRTYLSGYYSVATDSSKEGFDLSESTFRVGLRFEH